MVSSLPSLNIPKHLDIWLLDSRIQLNICKGSEFIASISWSSFFEEQTAGYVCHLIKCLGKEPIWRPFGNWIDYEEELDIVEHPCQYGQA